MNFIEEYSNTLDPKICEQFIKLFELNTHLQNPGTAFINGIPTLANDVKQSTEIAIDDSLCMDPDWNKPIATMLDSLTGCLEEYKNKYSFINKTNATWRMHNIINFQRFNPGEGFYEWHCENEKNNRLLVFMIYLNTVNQGGGTEFNYDMPNAAAEVGKCLIWPAYWTHFHRSIVAPKETKYILTGWYVFD